jgi:hypothetical protein
VGTEWKLRRHCSRYSVHRPPKSAIHGGPEGVYSMVLSFMQVVDDHGLQFRYRGEGGRNWKTKKLVVSSFHHHFGLCMWTACCQIKHM